MFTTDTTAFFVQKSCIDAAYSVHKMLSQIMKFFKEKGEPKSVIPYKKNCSFNLLHYQLEQPQPFKARIVLFLVFQIHQTYFILK
jgi:hypothetical protein